VKLIVDEPETAALRSLLAADPDQHASALVEVEVIRAIRRSAPSRAAAAQPVLAQLNLLEVTERIRSDAALLDPPTLRSLDAIHLATALSLGDELDGLVTYDTRLAKAAEARGLAVLAPS
jgi:predicted nucleic acid-binding protein